MRISKKKLARLIREAVLVEAIEEIVSPGLTVTWAANDGTWIAATSASAATIVLRMRL